MAAVGWDLAVQCSQNDRQVFAHLLAVALLLVLRQVCIRGSDLRPPALDELSRDDQGSIFQRLALVVQVLLPVRPAFVLHGS